MRARRDGGLRKSIPGRENKCVQAWGQEWGWWVHRRDGESVQGHHGSKGTGEGPTLLLYNPYPSVCGEYYTNPAISTDLLTVTSNLPFPKHNSLVFLLAYTSSKSPSAQEIKPPNSSCYRNTHSLPHLNCPVFQSYIQQKAQVHSLLPLFITLILIQTTVIFCLDQCLGFPADFLPWQNVCPIF